MSAAQGSAELVGGSGIAWPPGLAPGAAYVHAHNEMVIPAPAELCFAWLRRGGLWPTWYANCGWFRFDSASGPDLELGTSFTWQTFHAPVHSTVRRVEPPRHLEWDATAFGIRAAYHAWLLVPQGDRCLVITEETQVGLLPFLFRWYLKGMLQRGHQTWLEGLRTVTANGQPPA